jgi:hypothetical protein
LVACADLATNPSGKTVSGARSLRDWDVEDTLGVEWLDTLGCASGWTVVNSLIVCNPDPRPNQDTLDSSAER